MRKDSNGIYLKTDDEIKRMHELGLVIADILEEVRRSAGSGVSLVELNDLAEALCKKYKVNPSCKGYQGFPAVICTGVNDQAVHCIPVDRKLKEGDIATIDIVIDSEGWFVDHATTVEIGRVSEIKRKLVDAARMAIDNAIDAVNAGGTIGDVSYEMETAAKAKGFDVLKRMIGHGIGRKMHEAPAVPCFGNKGEGPQITEGMVFTIEPMLVEGSDDLIIEEDGWSTRTADGGCFAMFEHTVAITSKGSVILTKK